MIPRLDLSILDSEPKLLGHFVEFHVIGWHRFRNFVYLDDHLGALLDEGFD